MSCTFLHWPRFSKSKSLQSTSIIQGPQSPNPHQLTAVLYGTWKQQQKKTGYYTQKTWSPPKSIYCLATCMFNVIRKRWAHDTITDFFVEFSKMSRKKKKLLDMYFCTKVILSLAYVLCTCHFPPVGCCIHCLCKCWFRMGKEKVRRGVAVTPW